MLCFRPRDKAVILVVHIPAQSFLNHRTCCATQLRMTSKADASETHVKTQSSKSYQFSACEIHICDGSIPTRYYNHLNS